MAPRYLGPATRWSILLFCLAASMACDGKKLEGDAGPDTEGDADDVDGDADHQELDADQSDGDADQSDSDADRPVEYRDVTFPDGFLFGTAISGFQTEMGCPTIPPEICEDRGSDWYAFITSPETIGSSQAHLSGDPPSSGPGHYELYREDIARAADELHNDAIRISLEWSRIFPEPTDEAETIDDLRALADHEAVAHYHDVLSAIHDAGLEPLVTLDHYTLPTWLHDAVTCHLHFDRCERRGWVDRERAVREIAKYAAFAADEFGDQVDLWATLNEPFAILFPGYVMPTEDRSNPPAVLMHFDDARTVFVALVEAHARMYDAVEANDLVDADGDGDPAFTGVVYAMSPVAPADPEDPLDQTGADNLFYLWNLAYLDAVALGDLDEDLDGTAEHRDDLAGRMDYIGINYYTRITVAGTSSPTLPALSPLSTFDPFSLQPWEDYPRGLYEMATEVRDRYGLPVIITESGTDDPDDDGSGESWIVRHLWWAHRALEDGVDLRGFFYWTLMDNYEWNHGMSWHMGLYAVDPTDPSKARRPRHSVEVYGEICQTRTLREELLRRWFGEP